MQDNGFGKLYWGFLFIMINFRIMGFDIFPDIIGYILFAMGLGVLSVRNEYFNKARNLCIPLIALSILSIYQAPAGNGINFGPLGLLGLIAGIASIVLNLFMVYNIFKGTSELALSQNLNEIAAESDKRWHHYLYLQIAGFLIIVFVLIPLLGLLYAIVLLAAAIIVFIGIMKLMKQCEQVL